MSIVPKHFHPLQWLKTVVINGCVRFFVLSIWLSGKLLRTEHASSDDGVTASQSTYEATSADVYNERFSRGYLGRQRW